MFVSKTGIRKIIERKIPNGAKIQLSYFYLSYSSHGTQVPQYYMDRLLPTQTRSAEVDTLQFLLT